MSQRTILVTLLSMLALTGAASGQVSKLDKATLIEGLRKEGMRDLLKHMVETEPMDDPVLARQVLVNLQLLDYQQQEKAANDAVDAAQAAELRGKAVASFNAALADLRALIKEFYDHEQRPLWQTDLAELLLIDQLQVAQRNATLFYEFGVPTTEQRQAFEQAISEAAVLMQDADVRLFQLQSDLPKQPDHTALRVDTGLWARMMELYYKVRTQYSLAHAAYFAALLPDSAAYYQNLGNSGLVQQRKVAAEERTRLLALASERAERLLRESARDFPIGPACQNLAGRVLIAQGQPQQAMPQFDAVIKARQVTLDDLVAHLGRAIAMERMNQAAVVANDLASLAKSHGMVTGNLLLRLLVVDTRHQVLMRIAAKAADAQRAELTAAAYQPYIDLLADPSLGEQAQPIRNYIYQRWSANIQPGQDLKGVPPIVVAAMAEMLRVEGQNLTLEADALGEDPRAQGLYQQATPKLQQAVRVAGELLTRPQLSDAARAQGMFNQAYATYFLNRENIEDVAKAATTLTEMAAKYPQAPAATEAISSAIAILHALHAQRVGGVDEAYRKTVDVLIRQFPALPAAINERYYFAAAVLIPAGELEQAMAVLEGIPQGHPTYFEARREMMYCLVNQYRAADTTAKAALAQRVTDAATHVRSEATQFTESTDATLAATARNARGHASLILADMADIGGDTSAAIQHLEGFEQEHADDQELIRLALGKRILLLARAQQLDDAVRVADQMMKSFPNDAAAVVDQVLTALDLQADDLRRQADEELAQEPKQALLTKANAMARTAEKLARLLVDWANTQNFSKDEMVPYQLILAKSMRLAGNAKEAVPYMKVLLTDYPEDADVMNEAAEAMFALGGKDNLLASSDLYKRLIGGLQANEAGAYPRAYWNAWMRWFQILDQLKESTADIPLRVRQLQMSDPNLGGEPFKSVMLKLSAKYDRG
jgi:hypothetical protein